MVLSKEDAELFYELFFPLLDFVVYSAPTATLAR